jgi:uncharacterized membrane protein
MRNGIIAAALFASLLTLPTLARADDTTTGIVGGAVTGAIVGGPVGAVVGGVIGGTVGATSDENRREDRRQDRMEGQGPSSDTTCVRDRNGNEDCVTR